MSITLSKRSNSSMRSRGIENFRLIAAIMVVAIHTFPFGDISPVFDTMITLTVFRVAVPFFFMVTGYFVLGKLAQEYSYPNRLKVWRLVKKTALLYGVASLAYLPLSVVNGTISSKTTLVDFVKLAIFDGPLYHLWYFPALILGVLLVAVLMRLFKLKVVCIISGLLYLIALGGDSWSGLLNQFSIGSNFYTTLFSMMDYTRNGLLMAPIFLVLGAALYQRPQLSAFATRGLLGIGMLAMLLESYLLHQFFEPNHDSMYLFLPVVMVGLFSWLRQWQPKKGISEASQLSLLIYVIHPWVIAVIHGITRLIPFLGNSVLFFFVVLIGSFLTAKILLYLQKFLPKKVRSTRAQRILSVEALEHNLVEIKKNLAQETKIMAVVKANAYGCDAETYAKLLERNGVDFFAAATLEEGIALRKAGIQGKILILGYTQPAFVKQIQRYSLIQSIVSEEHAQRLSQQRRKIACHLQIDTGMHRLGMEPSAEKVSAVYRLPYLDIQGIYSHLGSSDSLEEKEVARTRQQITTYQTLIDALREQKIDSGLTHLQSSYGVLNYPELAFDYVRLGIILYGCLSSSNPTKIQLDLQPVMQLKAQLIHKRTIKAGEYLGYGLDTQLAKEMVVGVVSIGYADGLPRSLSEQNLYLSYQDKQIPQIGRICMDMLLVDLTHAETLPIDTQLTVLTDFEEMAEKLGTITNEILSRLGSRFDTEINK